MSRSTLLDKLVIAKAITSAKDKAAFDWEESQHPRGKGGKFTTKGSGAASGSSASKGAKQHVGSGKRESTQSAGKKQTSSRMTAQNNRKLRDGIAAYKSKAEQETASYPEGSNERHYGEAALKTLSSSAQRPTAEETRQLQEKSLGNISDLLKPYAKKKYEQAVKAEPQITSDLLDVCDETGAEMFGLPFRLKSAATKNGGCRIEDKIQEDMAKAQEDGTPITYEQAADNLSDLVRYTQACTTDNMADQFEHTRRALESKGYKCLKVKNSWDSYSEERPYRGINTVFQAPDGTRFELQFHTAESLFRKEFQHGLYEEQRDPRTPESRKAELGRQMYGYASRMQKPKGVERIKLTTDSRRNLLWRK